ncbi:hypothetical protein RND81_06G092600 [Saponaria officinalis]|uniref:HMG box domain-containing protein n=1 Tax=Saponaria officinalis TaxID=3572 RepID=A0AAW1K9N0_SAPOF
MAKKNSASGNGKMVLRIKMTKTIPRKVMEDEYCDKEARPSSAKRSKPLKKKGKKIDAHKPKKPPTAFFFFLEDFRKRYQEDNPEVKSMRDVGKACGVKWKTMTYEEKVKYYDIATEKRAEFDKAIADYTRRKESGEDPESELSESEFADE